MLEVDGRRLSVKCCCSTGGKSPKRLECDARLDVVGDVVPD
jgi:hypothetical protein